TTTAIANPRPKARAPRDIHPPPSGSGQRQTNKLRAAKIPVAGSLRRFQRASRSGLHSATECVVVWLVRTGESRTGSAGIHMGGLLMLSVKLPRRVVVARVAFACVTLCMLAGGAVDAMAWSP